MSTATASDEFGANIEGVLEGLPAITPDYVREAPKVRPNSTTEGMRAYNEDRVRIILEEQRGIPPTGQYFGLQGIGYILKPGVLADVPVGIVDILNHAIEAEPVVDDETQKVVRFRNKLRLPYRVLRHIKKGDPIPPMDKDRID